MSGVGTGVGVGGGVGLGEALTVGDGATVAAATELAATLGSVSVDTLAGAGRRGALEQPAALAARIAGFLKGAQ